MSDQMREIKERRAAFFKGIHAPTGWCDCIHCSAITEAPEDIDYLIARLESAFALVKELEAKLERHRGWTGLSLSHDLEKAEARIVQLENEVSALRQYGNKDCTAMADAVLQALKGDKS